MQLVTMILRRLHWTLPVALCVDILCRLIAGARHDMGITVMGSGIVQLSPGLLFAMLIVLAVGPVVPKVALMTPGFRPPPASPSRRAPVRATST